MTRHEADRVHEASGIAFTFAGHLVWGNPRLAGNALHGDVEAWRCSQCFALVLDDDPADASVFGTHAEQHRTTNDAFGLLGDSIESLRKRLDNISHGAFKPVEANAGAMPAAQMRRGAERVTAWRDAASVQVVEVREVPLDAPQQLRADGLDES